MASKAKSQAKPLLDFARIDDVVVCVDWLRTSPDLPEGNKVARIVAVEHWTCDDIVERRLASMLIMWSPRDICVALLRHFATAKDDRGIAEAIRCELLCICAARPHLAPLLDSDVGDVRGCFAAIPWQSLLAHIERRLNLGQAVIPRGYPTKPIICHHAASGLSWLCANGGCPRLSLAEAEKFIHSWRLARILEDAPGTWPLLDMTGGDLSRLHRILPMLLPGHPEAARDGTLLSALELWEAYEFHDWLCSCAGRQYILCDSQLVAKLWQNNFWKLGVYHAMLRQLGILLLIGSSVPGSASPLALIDNFIVRRIFMTLLMS